VITVCALGCTTRDGHPVAAPTGYRLCDRCSLRMRDTFADIVDRWCRIVPTTALLLTSPTTGRRAPGFASTPPGNVHLMAMRDPRTRAAEQGDIRSPLEVTHWWASFVRDQRGIRAPEFATVTTEISTLSFHWDWITREFEADHLVGLAYELGAVRAQLHVVTDDPPPPTVGYCTAIVDGRRCAAPLSLPPRGGTMIRCPACPASYDGVKLIRLYQEDSSA
jgi:hypothetical protein